MSTANNFLSAPNLTIKRKKRLLSSATRPDKKETNEATSSIPQKKRKRRLNIPTVDKPITIERTSSTSPPPTTTPLSLLSSQQPPDTPMPTPAKRSIRAAQDAITKREKQRQIPPFSPPKPTLHQPENKPVIKKKRKLNTQKILIPKSSSLQDLEENGDDSYDKYLESNTASIATDTTTTTTANTTTTTTTATTATAAMTTASAMTGGAARMSTRNHPASSFPLNIPSSTDEAKPAIVIGVPTKKRKLVAASRTTEHADTTTKTTAATEPEQDAQVKTSKLDLSQHSILPNQSYVAHLPQGQNNRRRRRRSTTASTATSVSSSIGGDSINSHTDMAMAMATSPETMFTMETYTTKSSPTVFYDAISDFEDMTIDDNTMMSSQIEQEEKSPQLQPTDSFWGSMLNSFKK